MKTKAKTYLLLALALVIAAAIAVLCTQVKTNSVFAEEVNAEQINDGYIVSTDVENIAATFGFTILNETECSVRITNKTVATKAIIPSYAEIDGKRYKVTEIAANGFTSSPKLTRVSLSRSVRKIGNNAFASCAKLNRVNLANVQEIGNSVFNKCPELTDIVIPKSVKKMGTYVFRNNNTQVKVRTLDDGTDWSTSWNKNNANQNVEYGSQYIQPIELEPIYDLVVRSSEPIGYAIADGQPRNDDFYGEITEDNRDDVTQIYNKCIFIPAQYNGKDVLKIAGYAFGGFEFEQLIVEYSSTSLSIESYAFAESGKNPDNIVNDGSENMPLSSIVINRDIEYCDDEPDSIFADSYVKTIVLPQSIESLTNSMFANCKYLSNVFFIEPKEQTHEEAIKILDEQNGAEGVVHISENTNIKTIGDYAFQGTDRITELHLYYTTNEVSYAVGALILEDWIYDTDNPRTVYVHNNNKLVGWDPEWNSGYENVVYNKEYYTITLNPNGGHFVNSEQETITKDVIFNAEIGDIFEDAEKEENELNGWFDKNRVQYTSTTIYKLRENIELFADWQPKMYTIAFDLQEGEGDDEPIQVSIEQILPSKEAPTRKGYTFQGYYEFPKGKGTVYYYHDMGGNYVWDKKYDITVYAHWEPEEYNVFLYDGLTDELVSTIESQKYDKKLPDNLSIPQKAGYVFKGYYDGKDSNSTQYFDSNMQTNEKTVWDKAEDSNLYSHWTIETYTIKYEIENKRKLPSNYNNPNPKSYTIEDVRENPIIIQSVDTYGYTINWDIDKIKVNSTGNITIYGTLTPNEYTITYDLNGGSDKGDNPETYNVENAGKLNDAIHQTLYFKAWTLNGNKITSLAGLYKDITLVATWTDVRTIHITQAFQELLITDPKVSIIMDVRFTNSCVIKIASSVTMVGINGNGGVYNMSIVIENRQSDFGLYLHNIGLIAPQGKYAIQMSSNYTLYLYHTSTVVIRGHSPTTGNGGTAIKCYQLVISSFDNYAHNLTIQGGKGSDGIDGINGGDGGNGGVGIIANKVIIACDYVIIAGGLPGKGGNSIGGNGYKGYGGAGAYPVNDMQSTTKIYVTSAFGNVHILISKPGTNGVGRDNPGKDLSDIHPNIPDTDPNLNPDIIINPPIGDKIPTPGPYVPPGSYI